MKELEVSLPGPCGENWDSMSPRGCNRHCAACDTVIHDLSEMTLEEAERLISASENACVRARIAPDGTVAVKHGQSTRRIKAVVGGSLALAVAACQTTSVTPLYEITGAVSYGTRVDLLDHRGVVKSMKASYGGEFRFDNLHAGTYTLRTYNGCSDDPENRVEGIALGPDDGHLGDLDELRDKCPVIYVGLMVPMRSSGNNG